MKIFQLIGQTSLRSFAKLGRASLFFISILNSSGYLLLRPGLLVKQLYSVGVLTFWLITISGLFVGMVLGLQGVYTLSTFGASHLLASWLQHHWLEN